MGSQGGFGQSKEFLDLIKSIGEARSKAEEDRIVINEIETLKKRIIEPDIPKRKMKEYIIRLVYVEMLGHDASFGYIHAVKMTHDDNLHLKRTGYLAVTLFLNEDHDLIILIVNTIQKDLKSDNYLVVCAALNAVCKLINEETIPAVLPQVVELLGHSKEAVRKKAVMALHRFFQKSPSSICHLVSNFRKRLCDNDPGVMGATLCPLYDLIAADVNSYKDLVVSFVSILKQVAERRLPKSYDYHQMPAPFIQIKLLKILALLGSSDKKASEQMYTIVGDIMRKSDSTSNIGNAILYECICCVSSIHPNPKVLESAAEAVAKFLKNDSHNLKYLGIDALGRLIKISAEIAEQHQLAVIDCLEDPDDTLKRKTFELLYKMTKPSNVEVIVDRMIDYMMSINDNHYKTEIASRCVELAEQFAPSNQWFIQTMNKVFEHAGDLVNLKVAHNLMRLIAEGFGEDDDTADTQLRSSAVESYLRIMGEPKLPSAFLQVICWVLGEYGTADGKYSASYITGKICDIAEAHSTDDMVKAYAVSALMKVYSFEIAAGRKVDMLPECESFIEELLASHSTDLQQRAYELQAVVGLDARAVENIMPMDASCEDIEVDRELSFLNGYVQESLNKGAQPYIPENAQSGALTISSFRHEEQHGSSGHSLRFEAYELPKPSVPSRPSPVPPVFSTELVPVPEPTYHTEFHEAVAPKLSASGTGSSEIKLRLDGVQRKWGKQTYSSSSPSTSDFDTYKTQNGATQRDVPSSLSSKTRDVSYESRRQQEGHGAALHAVEKGLKTAIIEGEVVGGTCVNRGCVPSKALLAVSGRMRELQNEQHMKSFGLQVAAAGYDRQAVADHANNLASKIRGNLTNSMKALGVDILTGFGTVLGPQKVKYGDTVITAKDIIIATGSVPSVPKGIEVDGKTVITSDHALKLEFVPNWIAIVGSGYIGLEFSDVYTALGSEVTFVEALDQLMPGFDPEIGKLAQRVLINPRKIDYHTGVCASKITPARDGKPVLIELIDAKTKEPKDTLEVDAALIATGRAPFTQGLGLENINVQTQRGFVPVDERMQVIDANGELVPHLYCIGDANGKMMLAHAASAQGISVVEQVTGKDHILNHLSIPAACFTHPEISMVGLTEPQAREKAEKEGFEISIAKTSFKANTKALAENEGEGLAKLIYRPDNGEILGVHIFGMHAADLIHEASNAIALGSRIQDIKYAVHAHPTLSEVIDELFKSAKVKTNASSPIAEPVAA